MEYKLPNLPENFIISGEGLARLARIYDPKEPTKHILWTDDATVELPIRMSNTGIGSQLPKTLIDLFDGAAEKYAKINALATKIKGKWIYLTYEDYYKHCCYFAKGLMQLGITYQKSVSILGFNAAAWHVSFFGSIFGGYIPIGLYTTSTPDACKYLTDHSESEVVVVEDKTQLEKYYKIWDSLPRLKYIIIYNDRIPADLPPQFKEKVLLFSDLLELGQKFVPANPNDTLEKRMKNQKAGNCCTIVYTSGTTGMPKGVMLSHDNYSQGYKVFESLDVQYGNERIVSYLPLSHVAAQAIDIIGIMYAGGTVYFADPSALQGTLVETLKEVKPTFFFSVPRVWEKIEEKMKHIASKNGSLKKKIAEYAKSVGTEGTLKRMKGEEVSFAYNMVNKIIFTKIKEAIGLDQSRYFVYGAAPLSLATRNYFFSLGIYLNNSYGMSECAGAETTLLPTEWKDVNMKSAGKALPGTELIIFQPDESGNGEICWRGRNVFMGYYKNSKATKETIDENGYLHSGDVGKLDEKGNLLITGRIKELIKTSGGENVAPVLIENEIKDYMKFISNAVVIGENKKYLTVLLTLKSKPTPEGMPTDDLAEEVVNILQDLGLKERKISELIKNKDFEKIIHNGIEEANKKAISRVAIVKKFRLLPGDFTVQNGEFTPTLKLKREVIREKYKQEIESMYMDPNL